VKKFISITLTTVMLLVLFYGFVGAQSSEVIEYSGKPMTITIATHSNNQDIKTVSAFKMKEELETRSNGKITVEVYPSSQLLNQSEMVEGIPNGSADIGITGLGQWSGVVPEVVILGSMGVFDTEEHYWRACEGEGGLFDYLAELFDQNADTQVMTFLYCGSSDCLLSKNKQIKMPEDMQGLKFRAPNIAMGSAVEALGATPISMPLSDVYSALQTGMVEGTWANITTVIDFSLTELAPYLTRLPLAYSDAYGIVIGNMTWNSWPEELQIMVKDISKDLYKYAFEYIRETVEDKWQKCDEDPNLNVYYVADEDVPAFAKLIGPRHLEIIKDAVSEESYKHMLELVDQFQ